MLKIDLLNNLVRFEPPQRLLLLEVTRRSDGFSFQVVPADAVQTSAVRLVSRSYASEDRDEASTVRGTAAAAITRFPLIGELDISNVPEAYKVMPADVISSITFKAGEQYSVTLVSDAVYEIEVVAQ